MSYTHVAWQKEVIQCHDILPGGLLRLGFLGGLVFGPGIFWGFCWKPWGFFWVLLFAPIRSSPSLEIQNTLPGDLLQQFPIQAPPPLFIFQYNIFSLGHCLLLLLVITLLCSPILRWRLAKSKEYLCLVAHNTIENYCVNIWWQSDFAEHLQHSPTFFHIIQHHSTQFNGVTKNYALYGEFNKRCFFAPYSSLSINLIPRVFRPLGQSTVMGVVSWVMEILFFWLAVHSIKTKNC